MQTRIVFEPLHFAIAYLCCNRVETLLNKISSDKLKKYNGTILDGEYIFFKKYNRHVFLAFDCLFNGSEDIRIKSSLMERLAYAEKIINTCFLFGTQTGYETNKNNNSKTLNEFVDYYTKDIINNMTAFNKDLMIEQKMPLIRRKYFIGVSGMNDWEIFVYASLLYSLYTDSAKVNCPYLLDGLMFHPLEQAYVSNRESKKIEYKWKPPEKNSIDFYIEFEKDKDTGKILTIYDNSNPDYEKNKPYQICYLHVGQRVGNYEKPVLFMQEKELFMAYIYLKDGAVRDIEGNQISDKTVVEFYYDMNPETPARFKWVPMKTRHDKTDSVNRFGIKYGNYQTTAEKVWRSIITPILMTDINDLAKGNNPAKNEYIYENKMIEIKKKISHELIVVVAKEGNAYYQQRTTLVKPLSYFHNWIKSNLIYTYCNREYNGGNGFSVLDMGIGVGGDLEKFSYSKVAFVVGFDPSLNGIESPTNGCISRYDRSKRKTGYPKMYFFHGDAGALLNVDDQTRALQGLKQEYKLLLEKFFPKDDKRRTKFDCINCQFMIHYLLKDEIIWGNYKQNIRMSLKEGGYLLVTTFDAHKVIELLKDKQSHIEYYTNDKGEKKKLFEIVKKYDESLEKKDKKDIIGLGHPIDIYISWISNEDTYLTEYLVDNRFLQHELEKDCLMDLIDTDYFENIFKINKKFLMNSAKYESVESTRTYLNKSVAGFYEQTPINRSCHIWNNLFRYYVFKKKEGKLNQHGGESTLRYDFTDKKQFSVANMDDIFYNPKYSFMNSLHKILQTHKIIPKSLNVKEFYEELKIKLVLDDNIDYKSIAKICRNILIKYESGNMKKTLDGINIFVIDTDCNGYDIEYTQLEKSEYACIIMKDKKDNYVPLFFNEDSGKYKGFFKVTDEIVKHISEYAN